MKTQGSIIKQLREEKELTQKELGNLLGVSKSTVTNWEADRRKCDVDTLLKMAQIFDVTLDYLTGLTPNKKPLIDLTEKQQQALKLAENLTDEQFKDLIKMVVSMKKD